MPVHKTRIFTSLMPGSGSATSPNHRPREALLFTKAFIPYFLWHAGRSNQTGRSGDSPATPFIFSFFELIERIRLNRTERRGVVFNCPDPVRAWISIDNEVSQDSVSCIDLNLQRQCEESAIEGIHPCWNAAQCHVRLIERYLGRKWNLPDSPYVRVIRHRSLRPRNPESS